MRIGVCQLPSSSWFPTRKRFCPKEVWYWTRKCSERPACVGLDIRDSHQQCHETFWEDAATFLFKHSQFSFNSTVSTNKEQDQETLFAKDKSIHVMTMHLPKTRQSIRHSSFPGHFVILHRFGYIESSRSGIVSVHFISLCSTYRLWSSKISTHGQKQWYHLTTAMR